MQSSGKKTGRKDLQDTVKGVNKKQHRTSIFKIGMPSEIITWTNSDWL